MNSSSLWPFQHGATLWPTATLLPLTEDKQTWGESLWNMGPAHVACTPGRVDVSNTQNFKWCFLFKRRKKKNDGLGYFLDLHFTAMSLLYTQSYYLKKMLWMEPKAMTFAFSHKMDSPEEFSQLKQVFSGFVKAGKPWDLTFPTGLFSKTRVSPGWNFKNSLLYHRWYFLFSFLSWCSSPSLLYFQVSSPFSCIFLCPPLNFTVVLCFSTLPASINIQCFSMIFIFPPLASANRRCLSVDDKFDSVQPVRVVGTAEEPEPVGTYGLYLHTGRHIS